MPNLKIIGLNLDIAWKNKVQNFKKIEDAFKDQTADLFVLPEMFSTGFCMDAEEIADDKQETLTWMQNFAKKTESAICGSASIVENGQFKNRFYFVRPDASYDFYDKKHLFSYSGEDKIYTPGSNRKIIEYKGFRILLQVCYDLRFPVFARNRKDYDLMLNVANWPKTRVDAWKTLLKARSIENQAFVFGLNRIGNDGNNLDYVESSLCFFPDGEPIQTSNNNLITCNLNLKKLTDFRLKFPFLEDADTFDLI